MPARATVLLVVLLITPPALSQIAVHVQIEGQTLSIAKVQEMQGASMVSVDVRVAIQQCQAGTYSEGGSASSPACVLCPAGTASAQAGASNLSWCAVCPTGTYAAAGSTVCIPCPASTFSVTPHAGSSSACIPCPAGSEVMGRCACMAPNSTGGKITAQQLSGSCSVPNANITAFLNQTQQLHLTPANLTLFLPGSWNCTGLEMLMTCAAGQDLYPGSAVCCMQCPPAYSCPGDGSKYLCPAGTFSTGGSVSCSACRPGYYCVNGGQAVCPAGVLSPAGASGCSVPCPAGSYCPWVGYALPCLQAGTYSAGHASYNCSICEAGFECPTPSQHVACPPGTWSKAGSTNCTLPCPAGPCASVVVVPYVS